MEAKMTYETSDLDAALDILRAGGIILYPTDTVWGIGCDATNEEAVRAIYRLKQRSDSKSMLVLLDEAEKLDSYVCVPASARALLLEEKDRPLTIIYPEARNVACGLIAEDGSLGIRLTNEAFSKALCRELGHPLVSTSANLSGEPAAKTYRQISEAIRQGVDYICRYRRDDETEKQPSRIVKITSDGAIQVIRD